MKTIIIAAVACTGTAALVSAQSTQSTKRNTPERIVLAEVRELLIAKA